MFTVLSRRRIRRLVRIFRAIRNGWRWEKVDFNMTVPLSDGKWSRSNGGQIWRRWNGQDYDYRQARSR